MNVSCIFTTENKWRHGGSPSGESERMQKEGSTTGGVWKGQEKDPQTMYGRVRRRDLSQSQSIASE